MYMKEYFLGSEGAKAIMKGIIASLQELEKEGIISVKSKNDVKFSYCEPDFLYAYVNMHGEYNTDRLVWLREIVHEELNRDLPNSKGWIPVSIRTRTINVERKRPVIHSSVLMIDVLPKRFGTNRNNTMIDFIRKLEYKGRNADISGMWYEIYEAGCNVVDNNVKHGLYFYKRVRGTGSLGRNGYAAVLSCVLRAIRNLGNQYNVTCVDDVEYWWDYNKFKFTINMPLDLKDYYDSYTWLKQFVCSEYCKYWCYFLCTRSDSSVVRVNSFQEMDETKGNYISIKMVFGVTFSWEVLNRCVFGCEAFWKMHCNNLNGVYYDIYRKYMDRLIETVPLQGLTSSKRWFPVDMK